MDRSWRVLPLAGLALRSWRRAGDSGSSTTTTTAAATSTLRAGGDDGRDDDEHVTATHHDGHGHAMPAVRPSTSRTPPSSPSVRRTALRCWSALSDWNASPQGCPRAG